MIAVGCSSGVAYFEHRDKLPFRFICLNMLSLFGCWAVWVTLAGALTYAEMGSMFPRAGGLYVYLRELMATQLGSCMAG